MAPPIELVVVACLIADPSVCREERRTFLNESGVRGCVERGAQPFLADWRRLRPGWAVQDCRCEPVVPGESDA